VQHAPLSAIPKEELVGNPCSSGMQRPQFPEEHGLNTSMEECGEVIRRFVEEILPPLTVSGSRPPEDKVLSDLARAEYARRRWAVEEQDFSV